MLESMAEGALLLCLSVPPPKEGHSLYLNANLWLPAPPRPPPPTL